jgi:hypothetical protein
MNLLGGHKREAFIEVKPHLVAKHALRARAGSVGLRNAMCSHVLHEIFVLVADRAHKGNLEKKL